MAGLIGEGEGELVSRNACLGRWASYLDSTIPSAMERGLCASGMHMSICPNGPGRRPMLQKTLLCSPYLFWPCGNPGADAY